MAARRPARRANASTIAAIERHNGPTDPRIPQLRQHGAALKAADELTAWAQRNASTLAPFAPHEAAAVGHLAAVIDARLAGDDHAATT
jgi:hypothetical protein